MEDASKPASCFLCRVCGRVGTWGVFVVLEPGLDLTCVCHDCHKRGQEWAALQAHKEWMDYGKKAEGDK
jgi:hypothetical protein